MAKHFYKVNVKSELVFDIYRRGRPSDTKTVEGDIQRAVKLRAESEAEAIEEAERIELERVSLMTAHDALKAITAFWFEVPKYIKRPDKYCAVKRSHSSSSTFYELSADEVLKSFPIGEVAEVVAECLGLSGTQERN